MPVFDIAAFRVNFPAYADETAYPDSLITAKSEIALCYISENSGCDCFEYAWQLMVAHLLYIDDLIAGGGVVGQVTGATVDKVSVTIAPPDTKGGYSYWLSTTPYGNQLRALLKRCSIGGAYIGGRSERSAFRSAGGTFPNGGRVWR